jgi:two-component system sensor histidine kinase RegB
MVDPLPQLTQYGLIKLRWLSVLAMIASALASPYLLGTRELLPPLLALTSVVGCINVCLLAAFKLERSLNRALPFASPAMQLTFDLLVWSIYIYISGGTTNPMISVFLPLVAVGAVVLSATEAWMFGLVAICSYSLLWIFHRPLILDDAVTATRLHLLGMWLVFVVSSLVVTWFLIQMTRAIRLRDEALAEAREQTIRNDWIVSLGTLAAGAAHDLSTPLATLNILLDELQEDHHNDSGLSQDLQLMQAQVASCKKALTQLTARTRYTRKEDDAPCQLGTWLNALGESWQTLHPEMNICTTVQHLPDTLGVLPDIGLERAIVNLLDNALHAGADRIHLSATVTAENGIQIIVSDNGKGISEETVNRLEKGLPSESSDGMGIGLLLGKASIERCGGQIQFEARHQEDIKGTVVIISLPHQSPIFKQTK